MVGVFLVFRVGVLRAFMVGVFLVFRVGDFRVFTLAALEALAEVAGDFNTIFLAVLLVAGLAMGIFLAPALAAFLEAAEFGAAMVLTSGLFAGQWDTVKDQIQMNKISLID